MDISERGIKMDDTHKTNEQLIAELYELREKLTHLEMKLRDKNDSENVSNSGLEKYHTLFAQMHIGVVFQDCDGHILSANPAAERILGISLDQMQGRTSMDPRWKSIHEDGSAFPGREHPAMVALKTGKPVLDVIMGVFPSRQKRVSLDNDRYFS